ncbi:MAG: cupin domain-containing protein [Chloroflexota bacterium]|nr:cupin domain-containing protein [Chloroflexota bacterium]
MPFLMKTDAGRAKYSSGTQSTTLVGKDNGGERLTVVEAGIDPGAGLSLHVHPDYQEVTLVMVGTIEAVLEGETRILGPGDVLLAPAGAKHTITNQSGEPAKVLAIYPTTNPERIFV